MAKSQVIQAAIEELEFEGRRIVSALAALRCLDGEPGQALPSAKVCGEPPARSPAKKVMKRAKYEREPKVTPVRTSDDRNPPGALQSAILAALKTPLSSNEIFMKLSSDGVKTTQGSVYQTCAVLKERRIAETRVDERDGQRRWHLLPSKEAKEDAA